MLHTYIVLYEAGLLCAGGAAAPALGLGGGATGAAPAPCGGASGAPTLWPAVLLRCGVADVVLVSCRPTSCDATLLCDSRRL